MNLLITMLVRPLGLVVLGALIAAFGAEMLIDDDVPALETLNRVEGALERITRPPPQRGESSTNPPYVFEVRTAGRETVRVKVESSIVDEQTLRELRRGDAFSALISPNGKLWELSIGTTKPLDYETHRAKILRGKEMIKSWSPYVIGAGVFISLLGLLWRRSEKSGYFGQFAASALILVIIGFLGWMVWLMGMEYMERRRVLLKGTDAQGRIIGAQSSRAHWLKIAWRDSSGAELFDDHVAVTKAFLDKLMSQKATAPIGIKYLVESGKPLAVTLDDASDLESTSRWELILLSGVFCVSGWLAGTDTWRAWRRWRTTPGAGL